MLRNKDKSVEGVGARGNTVIHGDISSNAFDELTLISLNSR
jgi:hypothetical protein